MAYIRAFGSYLPERVVDNSEIAAAVGVDADWILRASGITERRYAAVDETVSTLAIRAAKDCLSAAGVTAEEVGLILVASGSGERRFPGPASAVAAGLGLSGTTAIDLPLASAGSLFALSMASQLAAAYGNVLVIGAEIMSRTVSLTPDGKNTAILFGDGAGACLVSADKGFARIVDSALFTDGNLAESLRLELTGSLQMDGKTIILQAARKLPRVISQVLERNQKASRDVEVFLMHQANRNLIAKVASALDVLEDSFYCNIERYGNTSSASKLIAAAEWWLKSNKRLAGPMVFAAFGAGLNWGALLAVPEEGR